MNVDRTNLPSGDESRRVRSVGVHRLAIVGAVCTFGLVFLGGSVTSNDAGLAVPDWPQTFGENMFLYSPAKWVGDVFFEHTHRLLGALVGMVMIAIALWTQWREPRASVRRLGWALLAMVIVQGVMGGLRVTENNIVLAIVHGCFAQLFFSAAVCMALVTSAAWYDVRPVDTAGARGLKPLCIAANLVVFGQLILGALHRHLGWGLVYHVGGAIAVTAVLCVLLMWLTGWFSGHSLLSRLTGAVGGLFVVQLVLGLGAVVTTLSYDSGRAATFMEWFVPSAHVVVGASVFAFSAALTLGVHRVFGARRVAVNSVGQDVDGEGNAPSDRAYVAARERIADYVAVVKPRVTCMVAVATVLGFYLGKSEPLAGEVLIRLLASAVGMISLVGGANALNQVLERRHDARMERTADRPVAAGRLGARAVLWFALGLSFVGLAILAGWVNWSCMVLAAIAWAAYVFAYTPLKRIRPGSVLVGAVPGALPPVIGWAAAGPLEGRAFVLFAIMFIWQLPHFLAIAWLHRDDYAKAGYRILPVVKPDGRRVFTEMIAYSLVLIPVSLLPSALGMAGALYYFGAFVLGFVFLAFGMEVARLQTRLSARHHLRISLVYLTLLFVLMSVDKIAS